MDDRLTSQFAHQLRMEHAEVFLPARLSSRKVANEFDVGKAIKTLIRSR